MATDYQEAIRILSEQEKILQFDSFTSEDAWKLGNIMVEEIRNQGIDLTAVSYTHLDVYKRQAPIRAMITPPIKIMVHRSERFLPAVPA